MAIDEAARHQLYLDLEQSLGHASATAMMELLPPVGWADVATKRDLDALEMKLEGSIARLAGKIDKLEGTMAGMPGRLWLLNVTTTLVFTGSVLAAAKIV